MFHTESVTDQDPVLVRRRYVVSTACIFLLGAIGCVLVSACTFAAPYGLWISLTNHDLESLPPSILAFLPFGALAWYGVRMVTRAKEQRRLLAYVPPVVEPFAVMPAESVLARGAERPDPRPEELLRSCAADARPPAEELLRAGDNGSREIRPSQYRAAAETLIEIQET